jgi:hypothetical protein
MKAAPDCCVCVQRKECEMYREGSFCTRFRSSEPERYEKPDPNELWKRGEPVDL